MTQTWIYPERDGALEYRKALGAFATGVTVVVAHTPEGEIRAFTANSFTSVSLDPALVLVCLAKSSSSLEIFRSAEQFSINILSAGQRDLSNAFASRDPEVKKAAAGRLATGNPAYVPGALAVLVCGRHELVDAGDHVILIGRVRKVLATDGQPLGFFRGGYVDIDAKLRDLEAPGTTIRLGGLVRRGGQVMLCRRPGSAKWEIPTRLLGHGERYDSVLDSCFEQLGVPVENVAPYSLFQEVGDTATTLIFAAELAEREPTPPADGTEIGWFSQADAPWTLVEGTMQQAMVKRYLREVATGSFGVYYDSPGGGNIMAVDGRPRTWGDWHALAEAKATADLAGD